MTPLSRKFETSMRRALQICVALAAVLSVVAPLLHLHYRGVADDASSHCLACTAFHAVDVPMHDLDAPEQSVALVITAVERTYVAVISSRPSRAPPQPLG